MGSHSHSVTPCTKKIHRIETEITEREIIKYLLKWYAKTGQSAVIRCLAQADKHGDQCCFMHDWPLLHLFLPDCLSIPPLFPFSADCLMIWYNPRDSSQHHEPSGLHPYQLQNSSLFPLKWFLQFLDSQLIIMTDEIDFFSLFLLLPDKSGRSMSQCGFFQCLPLEPSHPFWSRSSVKWSCQSNFLPLHFINHVTDHVCFLFVCWVCPPLCLASSSFIPPHLTMSLVR